MKAVLAFLALAVSAIAQDAVQYLGRVNPATKELTWPGTGIRFAFTGTSASIALASVNGANSLDLYIDGGKPKVISNVAGNAISTGTLRAGRHTVELRHRSEANLGTIFLGNVTVNGTFEKLQPRTRQIEVIGDSITVGYGLDGELPCVNSAALEDNPSTYAALAAESLNADYNVIAWSGKGVVRNYASGTPDTSPLIPELWTRYGANDADDSYTFPDTWDPQAVVINLGTNDFGYLNAREPLNATVYTDAMVDFVQTIESHWPDAEFFLMTSPMLSDSYPTAEDAQKTTQRNALEAAIEQIGENAHLVDWPTQGADVGCDYHPNAATHAAEAPVLASAIAEVLDW